MIKRCIDIHSITCEITLFFVIYANVRELDISEVSDVTPMKKAYDFSLKKCSIEFKTKIYFEKNLHT